MESEMFSKKGRRVILIDCYEFTFHKNLVAGSTRWKCIEWSCKAFLKRDVRDLLILAESNFNHGCQVNMRNIISRQRINNVLEKTACNTFPIRPSTFLSEEVKGEDANILIMIDVTYIRKNIHAIRVKEHKLPKNVDEVHNIWILRWLQTALRICFITIKLQNMGITSLFLLAPEMSQNWKQQM